MAIGGFLYMFFKLILYPLILNKTFKILVFCGLNSKIMGNRDPDFVDP
jgi:hypothetical protein